MRALLIAPVILFSACSSPEEAPEPEAATQIDAGEWEIVTEVTRLTATDKGRPAIDMPVGTRVTGAACVGDSERSKPPPAMFAGPKDKCEYKNFYMARGRLNASLSCTRPGLEGTLMLSVEGNYGAADLQATATLESYLVGSGDVKMASKITGKRTGACAATPAPA